MNHLLSVRCSDSSAAGDRRRRYVGRNNIVCSIVAVLSYDRNERGYIPSTISYDLIALVCSNSLSASCL
jgi:hypothetical protein